MLFIQLILTDAISRIGDDGDRRREMRPPNGAIRSELHFEKQSSPQISTDEGITISINPVSVSENVCFSIRDNVDSDSIEEIGRKRKPIEQSLKQKDLKGVWISHTSSFSR
jgi:hypothetical protein